MSSLDDIRWKQCVFICIGINSKNNKANCMSECILSRRMDAKHVDSSQPNLLGAIAPRRFGATNLLFLVHSPWLRYFLMSATSIVDALDRSLVQSLSFISMLGWRDLYSSNWSVVKPSHDFGTWFGTTVPDVDNPRAKQSRVCLAFFESEGSMSYSLQSSFNCGALNFKSSVCVVGLAVIAVD